MLSPITRVCVPGNPRQLGTWNLFELLFRGHFWDGFAGTLRLGCAVGVSPVLATMSVGGGSNFSLALDLTLEE